MLVGERRFVSDKTYHRSETLSPEKICAFHANGRPDRAPT